MLTRLCNTRNQALRLCPSIRDVEAFWYKTEIKIIYFLPLCLIVWFTLTPNFLYLKLKMASFFSEVRGWVFLVLCYHARHLQQIHWNENFCRMYGLAVIASIARLNICQILMRFLWVLVQSRKFTFLKSDLKELLQTFFYIFNSLILVDLAKIYY